MHCLQAKFIFGIVQIKFVLILKTERQCDFSFCLSKGRSGVITNLFPILRIAEIRNTEFFAGQLAVPAQDTSSRQGSSPVNIKFRLLFAIEILDKVVFIIEVNAAMTVGVLCG